MLRLDRQIHPGINSWLFKIVLMIAQPVRLQCRIRLISIVFLRLKAKRFRRRRAGNLFPQTAEVAFVVVHLAAKFRHDLRVLRTRGRFFQLFDPLTRPCLRINLGFHEFRYLFGNRLRLVTPVTLLRRRQLASESCIQCLAAESEVLLKLIRRHEQIRTDRIVIARSGVRREFANRNFHA